MCSQPSIKGNKNVKHIGLSLQREAYITWFLPRMLGADIINSPVTFALTVWPRTYWILLLTLIMSMPIHRTHLYGNCHMSLKKNFNVVMSEVLFCAWDWVSHHQKKFHQIVLCSNMPKINYLELDSWSVNQQWLLSHVDWTAFLLPADHCSAVYSDHREYCNHMFFLIAGCYCWIFRCKYIAWNNWEKLGN